MIQQKRGGGSVDIKERIKKADVKQWEIAEKIGTTEFTLSRWLRRPEKLRQEVVEDIEKAIEELKNK
ncbi:MAG TPA: hypothetical protein DCG34_08100 [Clostridiales bacterium]|nr:hypothetical protein [Clostridiales bacterium]